MSGHDWIGLYLEEDLGPEGDITSDSIFAADTQGTAAVVARQAGVLAGIPHVVEIFQRLSCRFDAHMNDGSYIEPQQEVGVVSGPVRGILAGERLALNLLGRMSGIATATRRIAERLADECSGTVVAGTRKTTPGFRAFEKEAISIGGGDPHRAGLYDEAMVKDNHREAAGGVSEAVAKVKAAHPNKIITVEVETLEDAVAAAAAGTDWIMVDNQPSDVGKAWAEAVWAEHPHIKFEASGGITADHVTQYGWADRVSLGALTHQAVSLDFGLDWRGP